MHIEQTYGKDASLLRNFDWIAGTSTGAILALLLATGTPLLDCLRLYLQFKDEVFVGEFYICAVWFSPIGSRPYDASILESFLKERFGEAKTMADIRNVRYAFISRLGSFLALWSRPQMDAVIRWSSCCSETTISQEIRGVQTKNSSILKRSRFGRPPDAPGSIGSFTSCF